MQIGRVELCLKNCEWLEEDNKAELIAAEDWRDLHLSPALRNGINSKGFHKPSKIQATALPIICPPMSKNMICQAQNGKF